MPSATARSAAFIHRAGLVDASHANDRGTLCCLDHDFLLYRPDPE